MKKLITIIATVLFINTAIAQRNTIVVDASTELFPIQPTMFGIFFEDINFSADGGLYAELIKNRSFEFPHNTIGWTPFGDVKILTDSPCFDKNPHYARLTFKTRNLTGTGLENDGFRGIGFESGKEYRFSMYVRNLEKTPMKVKIELMNDGQTVTNNEIVVTDGSWKKVSTIIKPSVTATNGRIVISLINQGEIDVDHISLFPVDTWKGRESGLRKDLAQSLYDLKPGLFRFPGGCIVEGSTLDIRYEWKKSVGPVENRPININRWNYTFTNRRASDYYQSLGLGFFEYFLLSEDLGAEPLPVLSCGLACQYENSNDPNDKEYCPVDKLQPFIDDALDLIEFANGDVKSKWGKVRADMGHTAPFNLKYIAIGNEQWGELYPIRLEAFIKAIKTKHPNIQIIGSSGPGASGADFDYAWKEMKRLNADLVDEHYYQSPSFFYNGAGRYDNYDRKGPKVFAGEYASHHPSKENNFDSALSEAAFMTGLERNADIVTMATYAPLFAHIDGWQWRPDLIWYDNLRVVRTPNYYVQLMYGCNTGDFVVPILSDGKPLTGQNNLYACASVDKKTSELIIKLVNSSNQERNSSIKLKGVTGNSATVITLCCEKLSETNSFDSPNNIVPVTHNIEVKNGEINFNAKGQSFNVIRIKR